MRLCFLAFALFFGLLNSAYLFAANASTGERILAFESEIMIRPDATFTVQESITVNAERKKIKRGIYRELLTQYKDKYGNQIRSDIHVLNVKNNGLQTPYHIKKTNDRIKIYVGDQNVILKPGRYTYQITYSVESGLKYFQDYDEFYWNITGHQWAFPIDQVKVKVHLPVGANVIQSAAYTGAYTSKEKDYKARELSDGLEFFTTRTLNPKEGLTIALAWPKGFVTEPTTQEKFLRWQSENGIAIYSITFLMITFIYYLIIWCRVGRDPNKGTIIPLFSPPKGLSPAMTHYVMNMNFLGETAFSAAIVNLAVNGYVKIKESGFKKLSIKQTNKKLKKRDFNKLGIGEKSILQSLFLKENEVSIDKKNAATLREVISRLKDGIKKEILNFYFVTNAKYFTVGIIATLIYIVSLFFMASDIAATFMLVIFTIVTSSFVGGAALGIYARYKFSKFNDKKSIFTFLFFILIGSFIGAISIGTLSVEMGIDNPMIMGVILILMVLMNIFFSYALKRLTLRGRKLMDQIEGFKMFLSTTNRDEIKSTNPPEITQEIYELYLPYAIAMGVENNWTKLFEKEMANAMKDNYSPIWYAGPSTSSKFTSNNIGTSIGASIAAGLTSSLSSASGSSGGGFSGGGGGGGGGGGW